MRMIGLGDVASILVPAVKLVQTSNPGAAIDVLTHGAGVELMQLMPGVNSVLAVGPEQWPSDLVPAMTSFASIADVVLSQQYDVVINFDTWFMPCFLARILKDKGTEVRGNYISHSIDDFLRHLGDRSIGASYFQSNRFLESSFPRMSDWLIPWWEKYPHAGSYPEFYLSHCCALRGDVDISLSIPGDKQFLESAGARKIVALSLAGSKASKQYPQALQLDELLRNNGYFVWGEFDGSLPMQTTLARLKVTDLLITVATSTQWLARLVQCPSLMIPGAMPPRALGAEQVVDKLVECQYCYQTMCHKGIDFSCMKPSPGHILDKVRHYFSIPGA